MDYRDYEIMLEENKIKQGLKGLSTWFKEKIDSMNNKIHSLRKKEPELPPEKKSVLHQALDLCKKIIGECKKGVTACKTKAVGVATKAKDRVMALLEALKEKVRKLASSAAGSHAARKTGRDLRRDYKYTGEITDGNMYDSVDRNYNPPKWANKDVYRKSYNNTSVKSASRLRDKMVRDARRSERYSERKNGRY